MESKEEIQVLKSLGEKVKDFREKKGLSQDQLAIEAEIPKNQIGRIERFEINTTILTLNKIALALDLNIRDLV